MSERITQKNLAITLGHFAKAFGFKLAKAYNDVGGLTLESYNGYRIAQVYNESGAITHPFGSRVRSAAELQQCMFFAMEALYFKERKGGHASNPHRNPGKFDDPLTEYLYRLTLDGVDTLGDVQEYGWHYSKLANVEFSEVVQAAEDSGEDEHSARKAWPRGRKALHAIISEDSNGFVYRTMFDSERELDKRWDRIQEELDEGDGGIAGDT